MAVEQGNPTSSRNALVEQLNDVNRKLSFLMEAKSERKLRGREHGQFDEANLRKNQLCIDLLKLRRQGDASIQVFVRGRESEGLHEYSQNKIEIIYPNTRDSSRTIRSTSSLMHLRKHYDEPIDELIGIPDRFTQESLTNYITRTISEIKSISEELGNIKKDGESSKLDRLGALRATLAGRVINERVNGVLTSEDIEAVFLLSDSGNSYLDKMKVTYNPHIEGQRWEFRMFTSDRHFQILVYPLIEALGGYDREVPGTKVRV